MYIRALRASPRTVPSGYFPTRGRASFVLARNRFATLPPASFLYACVDCYPAAPAAVITPGDLGSPSAGSTRPAPSTSRRSSLRATSSATRCSGPTPSTSFSGTRIEGRCEREREREREREGGIFRSPFFGVLFCCRVTCSAFLYCLRGEEFGCRSERDTPIFLQVCVR